MNDLEKWVNKPFNLKGSGKEKVLRCPKVLQTHNIYMP